MILIKNNKMETKETIIEKIENEIVNDIIKPVENAFTKIEDEAKEIINDIKEDFSKDENKIVTEIKTKKNNVVAEVKTVVSDIKVEENKVVAEVKTIIEDVKADVVEIKKRTLADLSSAELNFYKRTGIIPQ
jgi:hypothetical protein